MNEVVELTVDMLYIVRTHIIVSLYYYFIILLVHYTISTYVPKSGQFPHIFISTDINDDRTKRRRALAHFR